MAEEKANQGQQPTTEPTPKTTEPKEAKQQSTEPAEKHIDVNKLKSQLTQRIAKEQTDKNEWKNKFEKVSQQLKQLQGGSDEPTEEEQKLKDLAEQNKKLQAKLERNDTITKVQGVFSDNGLNINKDILNLIVTNDEKTTSTNAEAIINLINNARDEGRNAILKGKSPKTSAAPVVSAKDFSKMNVVERVQLKQANPELFKQLNK